MTAPGPAFPIGRRGPGLGGSLPNHTRRWAKSPSGRFSERQPSTEIFVRVNGAEPAPL